MLHLKGADVLIDFIVPRERCVTWKFACKLGVNMVIGTTGIMHSRNTTRRGSAGHRIVFAPNMSVGVNLLFKLLETASRVLDKGYDIEISKRITATKWMRVPVLRWAGQVIAKTFGRDRKNVPCTVAKPLLERDRSTIGFATVRRRHRR